MVARLYDAQDAPTGDRATARGSWSTLDRPGFWILLVPVAAFYALRVPSDNSVDR